MIDDPDYARTYTKARIIAWQYGWCLVAHGSGTRDLDLLMTPWTDHAIRDVNLLVRRIADVTGTQMIDEGKEKPHGRRAYTLVFPEFGDPRWIDLSVTPLPALPSTGKPPEEVQ